jgi:copper resistance protein B
MIRPGCTLIVVGLVLTPGAAGAQVMDDHVYSLILFDQLEYRGSGDGNPVGWDLTSWVGGDFTRLWVKSEGAVATVGGGGDAEAQVLYSRLFSPFWEWQIGGRVDVQYGGGRTETRVLAVLGLEGLAPYWFEVEPAVFVSHKGDVSARLTATYDMFITQRAIAQPRVEVNGAVQEVPEFGLGAGLNDISLGLRFRYEFRREYAPYLGIDWTQRFAGTADFARQAGEAVSEFALVGGLRMWF